MEEIPGRFWSKNTGYIYKFTRMPDDKLVAEVVGFTEAGPLVIGTLFWWNDPFPGDLKQC
jgi:hypothetical protein